MTDLQLLIQTRLDLETCRDHLLVALRRAHTVRFAEPDAFSPTAHLGDIRDHLDAVIDDLYRRQLADRKVA